MKVLIDFGGFYDSIHSDNIESNIEMFIMDDEIHMEEAYADIHWRRTHEEYSKAYVDRLNNEMGMDLLYIDLNSPRFYNYRTDKIEVEVNNNDYKTLKELSLDDDFLAWADPQLQSRDGFSSFYNGIKDLHFDANTNEDSKAILIGMVINWQIEVGNINEGIYDLEYEIQHNETINT